MEITGKNYIGSTLSNAGNKTFKTFNPILNTENEPNFYGATPAEVDSAMELAHEAFKKFAQTTGKNRAQFLNRIGTLLEENKQLLIERYILESGLTRARGESELKRTIFQCHSFADFIATDHWKEITAETGDSERKPSPKPSLRKINFPLGPVVVFGASNFPFAYSTMGGDSVAALAAGCPVVVKSHPMHAGTGELVSQIITQAAVETNMPKGTFSNLNDSGFEVGEKLVLHPFTKAVGFTGSIGGGTALYQLGQIRKEPIPVFAEMGSLNPIFIFPSAFQQTNDMVTKIADAITQSSGQFCTKPGFLFVVESDETNVFIQQLTEEIDSRSPESMLHPSIWKKYNELRKEISNQASVSILTDEKTSKANFGLAQLSKVNVAAFDSNKKLHQEVFGPHCLLIVCKSTAEMLHSLQNLEGQLTCSFFASAEEMDQNDDFIFAASTKAGRIVMNGVPTGVEVTAAMTHSGPFPACTDSRFTAVGVQSIARFVRPVTLQNFNE